MQLTSQERTGKSMIRKRYITRIYLAEHNINSGRRRLTYRIYDGSEA